MQFGWIHCSHVPRTIIDIEELIVFRIGLVFRTGPYIVFMISIEDYKKMLIRRPHHFSQEHCNCHNDC